MKKTAKRVVAVITIVAVLGVTLLTLGLIRVRQDKYFFTNFSRLQVYNISGTAPFPSVADKVAAELDSVRFSVLGAILEGQFGYGPRIVKDDDGEPIYLSAEEIDGFTVVGERYLLHFSYPSNRTIKVDGKSYDYNRAYVVIAEGSGEINEVRVLPYLADRVHDDSNGPNSAEFYEVPDLMIKMRTSKLFVTIANAISEELA